MKSFEKSVITNAVTTFGKVVPQVYFDVLIDGKTFRTILDGVSLDQTTKKFIIHEAKFESGVLSKNQKAFICALLRVGEAAVKVIPVGKAAGDVFNDKQVGKDVKSLINTDIKIHKETGIFTKESAGFDIAECSSL